VEVTTAAGGAFAYLWLLIGFPLAGAAILLFGGKRTNRWGHYVGTLAVVASAVYAVILLLALMGRSPEERTVVQHIADWIFINKFSASIALQLAT
jgi:NADH-quinone oxidoreductase subunit L